MKIDQIEKLQGCLRIPLRTFHDERGFFQETWNKNDLDALVGREIQFAQDNTSCSHRYVLRGLHFQNPKPQAKLIRVVSGSILDVVVDVRKSSYTFGCWSSLTLSETSDFLLWIPAGFAHGFLALENQTIVTYKATDFWEKKYEKTLVWNDPDIGIEWPENIAPIISYKDLSGLPLSALQYFD